MNLKTSATQFSHERIEKLKQNNPSLKLLNAANAPLILSFLYLIFIEPNRRSIAFLDITASLNDYLFHLRDIYGETKYPRAAKAYIDEWCSDENNFLRKYYISESDDPEVDLTPATEIAIEWLASLEQKQFIGTESRFLSLFDLLRDLAAKTEEDPIKRVEQLEKQKIKIEQEIQDIQVGIINQYDATQIKERFLQAEDIAKRLLGDFRQVEYNFRALDREIREMIATSQLQKGALLDSIFQEHDLIRSSDQGKSFTAFWEFLMSVMSQDELENNLKKIYEMDEIQSLNPQSFLRKIKFALLDAGEKVYQTNSLLATQLRKYLDDQAYLDNKRIMELIKSIEKTAVQLKDHLPQERIFAYVTESKPKINMIMERQLFTPPRNPVINAELLEQGETNIAIDILYQQNFIDELKLKENIEKALQLQPQVSLKQIIMEIPLEKGLAELIAYLKIASNDPNSVIDANTTEVFTVDNENNGKEISMPKIIFTRNAS